MPVQKLISLSASHLFCILLGCAIMFYAKPDKKTETDITQQKSAAKDTNINITANLDKKESQHDHETIKRSTTIKPDGTKIISEDIVKDFFVEKVEHQNLVLTEQVTSLETENTHLHSVVEEMNKPKVHITLIPSYSFSKMDFTYTLMIQKRVFWDCYLGVSLDTERLGIPLTCGF